LNQYADCEKYLNERVDLVQELVTEEYAVYSCYNDLFAFYLRTNLEKAVLLGRALNSEEEKKSIPFYLQKMFLMSTGVRALLLRPLICCLVIIQKPRSSSESALNSSLVSRSKAWF